jgi:glycosyltransferase involved in cell wall biosynthesis
MRAAVTAESAAGAAAIGSELEVLVVALGEVSRAEAEAHVQRALGNLRCAWFDRAMLRREPVAALCSLWRRRFDAAVLVAPDLDQPRLRLTSLFLALVRARHYWRIDMRGRCEDWRLGAHLARHAGAIARHLLACAMTLVLGDALLRILELRLAVGKPSGLKSPATKRVLYLRSQLWLGLSGGGSVAHTAGVIGGLQQLGTRVMAVSSDDLAGVNAATHVVSPEVWFDGWLRELEDLAFNIPFLLGALRAARCFRPDAIYQRHTAFNVAGAVLARLLKLPLVLEYNSSEVWKGRYWGGLRLECAARRVERINLGAANRIVVVSRVLRDELVGNGVAAERILVNPNGVDPGTFRTDAGGADIRRRVGLESSVVIGFSGTFGAWHGIPTLAQAVPLVLAARPSVRWLIMGDGPLRPMLDSVADGRVIRTGMLPHAEMPAYLAACDVLVSPHGRQADGGEFFGSPTKLYEYMATGRPIVASRIGQIAEVLEHERSALLVEPDDPPALAEAIVRLVDDACLRARLGSGARQAAEQNHTWQQNAARVLAALGTTAEVAAESSA